jgi:hypothetical protein
MNAGEPAGSKEVRFEDLDLIYIFSFDLGAPVEARDLGESFSKKYGIVEGISIPPYEARPTPEFIRLKAEELGIDVEEMSEEEDKNLTEEIRRAHAMFGEIISKDDLSCDPRYLELGRYARLKLADLNLMIIDPKLSYLGPEPASIHALTASSSHGFEICPPLIPANELELKCEVYLILHNTGVGVVTVWIHLNGDLSADNVIETERELFNAECIIRDSFGDIIMLDGTLYKFVEQFIFKPLRAATLFKSKYGSYDAAFDALKRGDITEYEIDEKLRTRHSSIHCVVCIRKHRCWGKCATAEDAIKRHLREIYGILSRDKWWRYHRIDVAKKALGENLSYTVGYAMFVAIGASLFISSATLDEELMKDRELNKELGYRFIELDLVHPMEFLLLSDMILNVYISVYRKKFEELKERRRRGEIVRPSEIAEIRGDLMNGLEEYNNVSLFRADPSRSIMGYGKERLRLSKKADVLKSGLKELSGMSRTFYEEESLKKQEDFSRAQVKLLARQEDLSRKQFLLTILFGVFGAFQAMEYLEPKLGFLPALAVTLTIFTLIYLSYKLYIRGKLHLFRRKKLDEIS